MFIYLFVQLYNKISQQDLPFSMGVKHEEMNYGK